MEISVTCPFCGATFSVPTEFLSHHLQCSCEAKFTAEVKLPSPVMVQTDKSLRFLQLNMFLHLCNELGDDQGKFFSFDGGATWLTAQEAVSQLEISYNLLQQPEI